MCAGEKGRRNYVCDFGCQGFAMLSKASNIQGIITCWTITHSPSEEIGFLVCFKRRLLVSTMGRGCQS
jgi:hypothetical protein